MEREASLLRCAKLSCYAEFNRMVHAIAARTADGPASFHGYRMTNGSSAEHLFYATLTSLLNNIVHDSDPESQKTELQQVYHWFCTNKPLIATKTKAKHQRPQLTLSSRPSPAAERPNTAPLLQHHSPAVHLPPRPFTSQFMKQSLGLEELHNPPPPRATPDLRKSSSPHRERREGGAQPQRVSVVEMSRGESGLKPSALLELGPVVGARMELQREMRQRNMIRLSAVVPPLTKNVQPEVTEVPRTPTPQSVDLPSSAHPPTLGLASPPVHVVELPLPQTLPTASRRSTQPAKRPGPKLASGFYCSRYRCGRAK